MTEGSAMPQAARAGHEPSPTVSAVAVTIPIALTCDRPSHHGKVFGKALAAIAVAGREAMPDLPDTCATCAFREGTLPNQSAGTALVAFKCVTGADPDEFACHHAMQNDWPTKICAGYIAAKAASFDALKSALASAVDKEQPEFDQVRADYDAWFMATDPTGQLDVYQLARAYARTAQGMSTEGENSRSEVEGEACQPGPKDAPTPSSPKAGAITTPPPSSHKHQEQVN